MTWVIFRTLLVYASFLVISLSASNSSYSNDTSYSNSTLSSSNETETMETMANITSYFSTLNHSLSFFAHADWGKGGWDGSQSRRRQRGRELEEDEDKHREGEDKHKEEVFYQGNTSRTMIHVANATMVPEFILALGDNFYNDGVASINDSMWNSHFRDVYFRSSVLRGVPWHAAFGNHDLGYGSKGVAAQLNRTSTTTTDDDGVWQMYGQWYSVKYAIPDTSAFVQVVIVDTTWLAPSENEATNEEGGVSVETQAARLERQLEDLEVIFSDTLTNPPAWLVVAGHYPMFSRGEKGDNQELGMYLRPLIEKYSAHAYLCGHDHIAEHLQYNNVDYFVTGHSTMNNDLDEDVSSNSTLIWAGEGTSGFTRWTATEYVLHVEYVQADTNAVLYSHTLTNPLVAPSTSYSDDSQDGGGESGGSESGGSESGGGDGLLLRGYLWFTDFLQDATESEEQAVLLGGSIVFLASAIMTMSFSMLVKRIYGSSLTTMDNTRRFSKALRDLHSEDNLPPGSISGLGIGFNANSSGKSLYFEALESSHGARMGVSSPQTRLMHESSSHTHHEQGAWTESSGQVTMPSGSRWMSPTSRFKGVSYETLESTVVSIDRSTPATWETYGTSGKQYDDTWQDSSSSGSTASDLTGNTQHTNALSVRTFAGSNSNSTDLVEETRPRRNSIM